MSKHIRYRIAGRHDLLTVAQLARELARDAKRIAVDYGFSTLGTNVEIGVAGHTPHWGTMTVAGLGASVSGAHLYKLGTDGTDGSEWPSVSWNPLVDTFASVETALRQWFAEHGE